MFGRLTPRWADYQLTRSENELVGLIVHSETNDLGIPGGQHSAPMWCLPKDPTLCLDVHGAASRTARWQQHIRSHVGVRVQSVLRLTYKSISLFTRPRQINARTLGEGTT
jgi:hypothetical protein